MRLLFIIIVITAVPSIAKILDVDFMESMTDGNKQLKKILEKNPERLKILYENYEAKKPSKMQISQNPIIPKVMHQIWLGKSEIPPLYVNYFNECKKLHPDWEFKIWSETDLAELELDNQPLFNQARSYPAQADIMRYTILYKFGGVYRDMDIKCYRPIDELNHMYDFYASLETPQKSWKEATINNGLIASAANNKIIADTLKDIKENYHQSWERFDNGLAKQGLVHAVVQISMLPLTEAFLTNVKLDDKSIALPSTYFMPLAYTHRNKISKILSSITFNHTYLDFEFIQPESLMNHNIRKNEILKLNFNGGNGMRDPARKRIFKKLSKCERQKYKVFETIYKDNMPYNTPWSKKSRIPQIIHFIIFNDNEASELQKILPDWQMLNGDFDIQIWQANNLIQLFPEIEQIVELNKSENFRFYLALRILAKFGGSYAHYLAKPHISLFEMGNKYNFYAGLIPVNRESNKLLLSQSLIGASINSNIIEKTLEQINLNDAQSLDKISQYLTLATYKGIYLNGKNIVMPAMNLGFHDPLQNDLLYIVPDYFIRFFTNATRSFTKINGYAIIEQSINY